MSKRAPLNCNSNNSNTDTLTVRKNNGAEQSKAKLSYNKAKGNCGKPFENLNNFKTTITTTISSKSKEIKDKHSEEH